VQQFGCAMEVAMGGDDGRSASDLADIDRASSAGQEDGKGGDYDSEGKLAGDTDEQKEAYDASYEHESESSDD
jgi:hypothetical protein